jgi:hypothetical protein
MDRNLTSDDKWVILGFATEESVLPRPGNRKVIRERIL